MNACILFILFSGAGYVTPACFTPYGEILEPQDVIYVQHLPEAYHHIVYESPRRYVRHYRPHRRYVRHWRGYRHNHRHHNIRRHRNIRPRTIVTGTSDDIIAVIIDEFISGAIINVDETIFRNYL